MNYCALNTQHFPGIYAFSISFLNEKQKKERERENVLMPTFSQFAAESIHHMARKQTRGPRKQP